MENIEDKKINKGIGELKELKMTDIEKETILKNILQIPIKEKERLVKSPFNISSFIFGNNLYAKLAVFLILVITGGGFWVDYQNTKKNNQIAINNRNINFSQNSYTTINNNTENDDNREKTIFAIAPINNTTTYTNNEQNIPEKSDSVGLIPNSKSMTMSTSGAPLVENNTQKYIDISKPVFEKWLENLIKEKGGAESYIINNLIYVTNKESARANELAWFTKESTKDAFIVTVNYSIKMTNTNDYNYWMAGNGTEGADNWILNKSLFITIDKNTSGYYISNAGTGM